MLPCRRQLPLPYIFTDLDGDEEQEAVVFYTVEDEPLVYLQILDRSDGRWRARNALPGTEGEVLFVDFRHLFRRWRHRPLVGWREPDREFDTLYLYRYRDAALSEEFHISCDGMAIADFDGDGYEELIAATVDGGVTLQYIGWIGVGISVLDSAYSPCACRTSWNRSPASSRRSCPAPFSPAASMPI